eukprot:symbB.v1.2.014275.t1/scaffold1033.1/size247163/13
MPRRISCVVSRRCQPLVSWQTSRSLVSQKMLDKVSNVTTEQAAAILNLLDESLWTADSLSKLKTMVAELTAEAEGAKVKRDTQDYRMLPHYMSSQLMEQLTGKSQENVALQALCKHAWLLGLRCPSELTLAVLLCMAHYHSVSRVSDNDKYNLLLSNKPLMKKWLGVLPDPCPYLLSLPQDPQELPVGMLSAVFPEGNVVEGPYPAAEILLLMPLRVSNKAVTDPKTAAAQGSGGMNSPARAFGQMTAGLMKGMGAYRSESSSKVTLLDTPSASTPQPRLLALEDRRPDPPNLPAQPTGTTPAREVTPTTGGGAGSGRTDRPRHCAEAACVPEAAGVPDRKQTGIIRGSCLCGGTDQSLAGDPSVRAEAVRKPLRDVSIQAGLLC